MEQIYNTFQRKLAIYYSLIRGILYIIKMFFLSPDLLGSALIVTKQNHLESISNFMITQISYKILDKAGSDISNLFYMNESIPGWVYTKASLDYEKTKFYELTVLAYDHGEPPKEASMEYTIEVDDENEFAPVFEGGKGPNGDYQFQMYGDLEKGSAVGNVSSVFFSS